MIESEVMSLDAAQKLPENFQKPPEKAPKMDDDSIELDDTIRDAQIIERNESGKQVIVNNSEKPESSKKPDEVVVLDDDDDEEAAKPPPAAPAKESVGIIDLVERYSKTIKKLNFEVHTKLEVTRLEEVLKKFIENLNEIEENFKQIRTSLGLGSSQINLYEFQKETIKEPEVTITHDNTGLKIDKLHHFYLPRGSKRKSENQIEKIIKQMRTSLDSSQINEFQKETIGSLMTRLEEGTKKFIENLNEIEEGAKQIRTSLDLDSSQINLYNEFQKETIKEPEVTITHDNTGLKIGEAEPKEQLQDVEDQDVS